MPTKSVVAMATLLIAQSAYAAIVCTPFDPPVSGGTICEPPGGQPDVNVEEPSVSACETLCNDWAQNGPTGTEGPTAGCCYFIDPSAVPGRCIFWSGVTTTINIANHLVTHTFCTEVSDSPTQSPTVAPTESPSVAPTDAPTESPSASPTPTLCAEEGDDCESDCECCSNNCYRKFSNQPGVCEEPLPVCSAEDEPCDGYEQECCEGLYCPRRRGWGRWFWHNQSPVPRTCKPCKQENEPCGSSAECCSGNSRGWRHRWCN